MISLAPLLPIVNPRIVIVNTDDELIEAPDIVRITAVLPVTLQTAVRLGTLLSPDATVGVTDGAKKLDG